MVSTYLTIDSLKGSHEHLSGDLEPAEGEMIPQINLSRWYLIGIIFPREVPHPDKYSCVLFLHLKQLTITQQFNL